MNQLLRQALSTGATPLTDARLFVEAIKREKTHLHPHRTCFSFASEAVWATAVMLFHFTADGLTTFGGVFFTLMATRLYLESRKQENPAGVYVLKCNDELF